MKAYVVVEKEPDADVLRAVLPKEITAVTALVPAGERSTLVSVARTLSVTRRKPVAVLTDARSVDERMIREHRQSMRELLSMVSVGVPFAVVVLVPEIEVLFFQAPEVLQRAFAAKLLNEVLPVGRATPREALARLLKEGDGPHTLDELLDSLTPEEVEALRSTGAIRELITFLNQVIGASAGTNVTSRTSKG